MEQTETGSDQGAEGIKAIGNVVHAYRNVFSHVPAPKV